MVGKKRNLPIWITADFECRNTPLTDPQRKAIPLSKPVEVVKRFDKIKNLFQENLKLEKHGYNKKIGEDCVECFSNAMLEIETFMKYYFESRIELKPYTIPFIYEKDCWWLDEKEFEKTKKPSC